MRGLLIRYNLARGANTRFCRFMFGGYFARGMVRAMLPRSLGRLTADEQLPSTNR